MTVAQVVLTLHYPQGSTPYPNIHAGSSIRFHPNSHNYFPGLVKSKDISPFPYHVPLSSTNNQTTHIGFRIVFHLLLQVPSHLTVSTQLSFTHTHTLALTPAFTPASMLGNIYPTLGDFYNEPSRRTLCELKLWFEGWKWWYLSRGICLEDIAEA
jgi:hypothetical protein